MEHSKGTIVYRPTERSKGLGALAAYQPEPDTSRADWVAEGCHGPLWTLHRCVPDVFEQAICIRHPGLRWPEDAETEAFLALSPEEKVRRITPVRWSELAQAGDHDPATVMQWHTMAPPYDYRAAQPGQILPPSEGEVPLVVLDTVFDALVAASGEDQTCIAAIWYGFGGHEVEALADAGAARISGMGQQSHYLMHASLGTVREQWRSVVSGIEGSCGRVPQALWPTTREWFFHAPFEMHASFLGGSATLTAALLASDEIDAYTVPGDVVLL